MTVATITRAEFLKAQERTEVASDTVLYARWGDYAGDTAQSSVLVNQADAVAEATRQLSLLASVRAAEGVLLEGIYFDLEGETVRVTYATAIGSYFGVGTYVDILVIKTTINLGAGTTLIEGQIVL